MENKQQNKSGITIVVVLMIFFMLADFIGLAANGQMNAGSVLGVLFNRGLFFLFLILIIFKSKSKTQNIFKLIKQQVEKSGILFNNQSSANPNISIKTVGQLLNQSAASPVAVPIGSDGELEMPADSVIPNGLSPALEAIIANLNPAIPSIWPITESNNRLSRKKKYLQVALNGSMSEARRIISELPRSEKIIIEAGTPLIKKAGADAVRQIRRLLPGAYIVADTKIADLASREVEIFKAAGANAITALGVAPVETLNEFVMACRASNIDAMIDMMNVESSIAVLKKLNALPEIVILHRGVDETEKTKGKAIPFYQINQIKGNYNLMVAVAGGDTPNEIQSAVFNGANIVVVWKDFMAGGGVRAIAESFLKEIK